MLLPWFVGVDKSNAGSTFGDALISVRSVQNFIQTASVIGQCWRHDLTPSQSCRCDKNVVSHAKFSIFDGSFHSPSRPTTEEANPKYRQRSGWTKFKFQKHLTLLDVALRTHCDPLNATQVEDDFQRWSVVLVFWLVCTLWRSNCSAFYIHVYNIISITQICK